MTGGMGFLLLKEDKLRLWIIVCHWIVAASFFAIRRGIYSNIAAAFMHQMYSENQQKTLSFVYLFIF